MAALLEQEGVRAIPKVGEIITGRVLSVAKNEVHLDIDGFTTGVVRGRELFDESGETSEIHMGDEVSSTVVELENENGQMELSFRTAGHRKAWDALQQLLNEGTVIDAQITDANRGGLMVKVNRIEGFLPVSQLTTEHYPRVEGGDKQRILEMLQQYVGQSFKAKVIDVNERDSKLIVSEKAAWEEAQRGRLAEFTVGQVVTGAITGVVDFGAFMEFAPGLEGLIHISELAWQRIEHPRDFVKVGQRVEAKIIGIEGTKVSLSVKKLTPDPWEAAVEKYHVGQVVRGTVVRLNTFGAFVELDPEIQGLCHISELSRTMLGHPSEVVKEGESYPFKILSIEPADHRLGLSKKALEAAPESEQGTGTREQGTGRGDESGISNTESGSAARDAASPPPAEEQPAATDDTSAPEPAIRDS